MGSQTTEHRWRAMEGADLPQVLRIERNTQVIPWSRLAFEESLTRSEESSTGGSESSTNGSDSSTDNGKSTAVYQEPLISLHMPSMLNSESMNLNHINERNVVHEACVLVFRDLVRGFYIISHIVDETHILNLAIDPVCQGRGWGHSILKQIQQRAMLHNSERIFLEVRSSNIIAQSLYRKWRYRRVAERKNYYRTLNAGREDAYIFVHELNSPEVNF